ncbi:unnamed protein product, partial [Effrenium voratum]
MASGVRRAAKAAGATGAAVLGWAYWQRLPRKDDHRTAWSESLSTRLYRTFALPLILQTDPETAHNLTLQAGECYQALRLLLQPEGRSLDWLLRPAPSTGPERPRLRQRLFGLDFENPVGIAAGFDKNALL